jgi:hypothetical protein
MLIIAYLTALNQISYRFSEPAEVNTFENKKSMSKSVAYVCLSRFNGAD